MKHVPFPEQCVICEKLRETRHVLFPGPPRIEGCTFHGTHAAILEFCNKLLMTGEEGVHVIPGDATAHFHKGEYIRVDGKPEVVIAVSQHEIRTIIVKEVRDDQ